MLRMWRYVGVGAIGAELISFLLGFEGRFEEGIDSSC